jgi:Transglutaminase-like superfamily
MRFHRPKQLTFLRLRLAAMVSVALVLVTVALRLFGFQRTQSFLAHFTIAQSNNGLDVKKNHIDNVIYVIDATENRAYSFNCLSRVVVASFFLARRGVPTQIRFGVRKHDEKFGSHAWLELDGQILVGGEGSAQAYVPLEFPNKRAE